MCLYISLSLKIIKRNRRVTKNIKQNFISNAMKNLNKKKKTNKNYKIAF